MFNFDYIFLYYLLIRYLKKAVKLFVAKRSAVANQLNVLGTAAYTSSFVYVIEKGFDFNFLRLALVGVAVTALASKLNR